MSLQRWTVHCPRDCGKLRTTDGASSLAHGITHCSTVVKKRKIKTLIFQHRLKKGHLSSIETKQMSHLLSDSVNDSFGINHAQNSLWLIIYEAKMLNWNWELAKNYTRKFWKKLKYKSLLKLNKSHDKNDRQRNCMD